MATPDWCEETDDTCIFCLIAKGQDEEAEIVKRSKELVCFKDIYPGAPHHYLVIPVQHIHSCYSLHKGHTNLVERMEEMGRAVLREQGITDMMDIRLGFHQPPNISVGHLHLHVLAPASQISKHMEYKFLPQTETFICTRGILKIMKKTDPAATGFKKLFARLRQQSISAWDRSTNVSPTSSE